MIQGRGYDAIEWTELEDGAIDEGGRSLYHVNPGSSGYLNQWIGNGRRRRRRLGKKKKEEEEEVVEEKVQEKFNLDFTAEEMEIVIDELKLVLRNACIDMIHDIAIHSSGYTDECRSALGRVTCDVYIDKAEVAGVVRGHMVHLAAETIDAEE